MAKQVRLEVIEHRQIAEDHFELRFPKVAPFGQAQPGQFVNVACSQAPSLDPLLRRPFSFYRVDDQSFSIVYRVVGRGTALLSRIRPGAHLDLLGPLGTGFPLTPWQGPGRALLVGGGVGVPPIFHLSQELQRRNLAFAVLTGFATSACAIGIEDWRARGIEPLVATDDGSLGHHGFVTDLLAQALQEPVTRVYACGPRPMLAKVVELADASGVDVYVAMEEWMACGVGVCLSCVCPVQTDDGVILQRVCSEGPVFDGRKVVWSGGFS